MVGKLFSFFLPRLCPLSGPQRLVAFLAERCRVPRLSLQRSRKLPMNIFRKLLLVPGPHRTRSYDVWHSAFNLQNAKQFVDVWHSAFNLRSWSSSFAFYGN